MIKDNINTIYKRGYKINIFEPSEWSFELRTRILVFAPQRLSDLHIGEISRDQFNRMKDKGILKPYKLDVERNISEGYELTTHYDWSNDMIVESIKSVFEVIYEGEE